MFINHYCCPKCDTNWQDTSKGTQNDRCPKCNLEVQPHVSQDKQNE